MCYPRGDERGPEGVALLEVVAVRPLEVRVHHLHLAVPQGRLAEQHEVLGRELHRLVGRAEELVALDPVMALEGGAGCVERVLDDLAHGFTVGRILEVCHAGPPA